LTYILNTGEDREKMLAAIGIDGVHDLFSSIPETFRLNRLLSLPAPLTEIELSDHVGGLACLNRSAANSLCFLGGGAYDHFIPAVVDAISSRSEYYTAYTPYQAEASQGSLQVFFEFQTLICQLTGMDVSNASLYEAGTAVTEAVFMAIGDTRRQEKVIVPGSLHPEYRKTLETYLANLEPRVETIPTPDGFLNPDDLKKTIDERTSCVVVQHPNFLGCLEEVEEIGRIAHEKGAIFIVCYDPISLGILKRPGQYDADIAVAEGQSLGNPLNYGGPFLGLLSCREKYLRRMPGRLVGQTVDRNGHRCWTLTLQTREQHIRREKATSNICTNQGLMALKAAVFLTALGPQGLKETAELCHKKARYAAGILGDKAGFPLRFDRPFFKEFTVQSPIPVGKLLADLEENAILGGLNLEKWYPDYKSCLTIAVTEKRTKSDIDTLVDSIQKISKK